MKLQVLLELPSYIADHFFLTAHFKALYKYIIISAVANPPVKAGGAGLIPSL